MVKIYVKENYVDFEAPIYMEDDYFDKFCKFMFELMGEEVNIVNIHEKERIIGEVERSPVRWTAEERFLLLNPNLTDNELVNLLGKGGRSSTSIFMQRAEFVPRFISWARSKGYDCNNISKTIVEEFMEKEKK